LLEKALIMQQIENYPYILKYLFDDNEYENIVDSNILSAYIPLNFPVPQVFDPRKVQVPDKGTPRHPAYARSDRINQIFNYIGFIKRIHDKDFEPYLPILFNELRRFVHVLEDIIYEPSISISEDIYDELHAGLQNFFNAFNNRACDKDSWIDRIWRQQKFYLEHVDMLLQTLKINGQVFDMKSFPLHKQIVAFCKDYLRDHSLHSPEDTDIFFVANVCAKAAWDNEPKTIWSGDRHIYQLLKIIYEHSDLASRFPQIYLRASYLPFLFTQLFPEPDPV
jgi:hypothetical protein